MQKRGRFSRNKRGVATELLIEAMQALAVMLILSGTLMFVNNELDKAGFAKRFYPRDMGLLITTIYSAQGNLFYLYNVDTVDDKNPGKYKFHFLIANNTVRVNATNASRPISYWYFSDLGFRNIVYEESNRLGVITFVKEGNRIDMGFLAKMNANTLFCNSVNTRDMAWHNKNLIIDPAHGESSTDLGAVNSVDRSFNEAERTLAIASNDGFKKLRVGQRRLLTRGQTTGQKYASFEKKAEFIKQNAESNTIILSIHIGENSDKEINYIKAYYNINSDETTRKKSSKLGCNILNSILQKDDLENNLDIAGAVIIPSDSEYIKKIIPAGNAGVLLEIGNMQIPKAKNFLSDTSDLAEAIYLGIEDYYTK